MSESGYLISKIDGSKDGYTILALVAASILYEFGAYLPPHKEKYEKVNYSNYVLVCTFNECVRRKPYEKI